MCIDCYLYQTMRYNDRWFRTWFQESRKVFAGLSHCLCYSYIVNVYKFYNNQSMTLELLLILLFHTGSDCHLLKGFSDRKGLIGVDLLGLAIVTHARDQIFDNKS